MAVANVAEAGSIAVYQLWWRDPAAKSRGTLALGRQLSESVENGCESCLNLVLEIVGLECLSENSN